MSRGMLKYFCQSFIQFSRYLISPLHYFGNVVLLKEKGVVLMYCKKCGNSIDDDSIFCNKCGTKLQEEKRVEVETPKQKPELTNDKCLNCADSLTVDEKKNGLCDKCFIKINANADKVPAYSVPLPKEKSNGCLVGFIVVAGICLLIFLIINGTNIPRGNTSSSDSNSNVFTSSTTETSSNENDPRITLAEYNSISTDMTYEEICKTIGSYGTELSSVDMGGYKTVVIMWEGIGMTGANANFTFQNGKLLAKAQFGLK